MIRAPKDFWSGVLFMSIGAAAMMIATNYPLGSVSRMGPGYFPMALGSLLLLIGAVCAVRSFLRDGEPVAAFAWRPLIYVLGSTVLCALLLRRAGLIVALPILCLLSATASRHFRWPQALALAFGLTAFSVALFVVLLGLPIPLDGSWFPVPVFGPLLGR